MINDIPKENNEKINKHIVYGGVLLGAAALYLFMTKNEDNSIFNGIEGLGIDVDPSRLIDSTVDKFAKHDVLNRGAKHLAKKLSYKLLG